MLSLCRKKNAIGRIILVTIGRPTKTNRNGLSKVKNFSGLGKGRKMSWPSILLKIAYFVDFNLYFY